MFLISCELCKIHVSRISIPQGNYNTKPAKLRNCTLYIALWLSLLIYKSVIDTLNEMKFLTEKRIFIFFCQYICVEARKIYENVHDFYRF